MDSLDCQLLQMLFSKERVVRIKEGTRSAFGAFLGWIGSS
jgi:hypothetical protein